MSHLIELTPMFFEGEDNRQCNPKNSRHPAINVTAVKAIGETLGLTYYRQKRLYVHICKARFGYDILLHDTQLTTQSQILKHLRKIDKVLSKLSVVVSGGGDAHRLAQWKIVRSASSGALKNLLPSTEIKRDYTPLQKKLRKIGFSADDPDNDLSNDALDMVFAWFRMALPLQRLVRNALSNAETTSPDKDKFDMVWPPKEWLCGEYLPAVYRELTGQRFGISRTNNQVNRSRGIAFVVAAVNAMGLGTMAPETAVRHWHAARSRSA